jgi:hypothetical protein
MYAPVLVGAVWLLLKQNPAFFTLDKLQKFMVKTESRYRSYQAATVFDHHKSKSPKNGMRAAAS